MIKDSGGSRKIYGVYRAVVFDNNDPNKLGRIRLIIPQVFAEIPTGWCWPSEVSGIATGVPEVGQGVWAFFEGGDPSFPIWTGVFGNEKSSNLRIMISPVAAGTALPYNFKLVPDVSGKNTVDLVSTLISVASVIDGGNA